MHPSHPLPEGNTVLKNNTFVGWLMALPIMAVLMLFLVLPIVMIVVVSFWQATEFSIIPALDLEN